MYCKLSNLYYIFKRLIRIFLIFLFIIPLFSHNLILFRLYTLASSEKLDVDGPKPTICTIADDIIELLEFIDSERLKNGPFRVMWLPFTAETKTIAKSSIGDPFSKGFYQDKNLSIYFELMLRELASGHPKNLAEIMAFLGFKYVVVLKNVKGISNSGPIRLHYYFNTIHEVAGDPQLFIALLNKQEKLVMIRNSTNYVLYLNKYAQTPSNLGVFRLISKSSLSLPVDRKIVSKIAEDRLRIFNFSSYISLWQPVGNDSSILSNFSVTLHDVDIKQDFLGEILYFNGYSSYVDTNISLKSQTFSLSGWILVHKITSKNLSRDATLYQHIIGTRWNRLFVRRDGYILFQYRISNGTTINHFSHARISFGKWHHVAVVFGGTFSAIYIDGIMDSLHPLNNSFTSIWDNSSILLGSTSVGIYPMNGSLYDWRIYSYALDHETLREQIYYWKCIKQSVNQNVDGSIISVKGNKYLTTKYEIVINSSGELCLVFVMRFDPRWRLKVIYENKTIQTVLPIKYADWANAYLIKGSGVRILKLEYSLQYIQFTLISISFSSYLFIFAIYVQRFSLVLKYDKKEKSHISNNTRNPGR